jgi:hypothetical protein
VRTKEDLMEQYEATTLTTTTAAAIIIITSKQH